MVGLQNTVCFSCEFRCQAIRKVTDETLLAKTTWSDQFVLCLTAIIKRLPGDYLCYSLYFLLILSHMRQNSETSELVTSLH